MSSDRKSQHLLLAKRAQYSKQYGNQDHNGQKSHTLCDYEPLWAEWSQQREDYPYQRKFFHREFKHPFWISAMTGGTQQARKVNQDLARLAQNFGIGLGLGSCRPYLEQNRQEDFDLRTEAAEICLAGNLGIAQVQAYLRQGIWKQQEGKLKKLGIDLLMIHINPLQEWIQKEGDVFSQTPFESLRQLKKLADIPLGVKEVGQGFGPKSLKALLELKVEVIELAGKGGTNFSLLEQLRNQENGTLGFAQEEESETEALVHLGHDWQEMTQYLNTYYNEFQKTEEQLDAFPLIIVSGGIRDSLEAADAFRYAQFPCLIGMGYPFLKWQQEGYEKMSKSFDEFLKRWYFGVSLLGAPEKR